MAVFYYLIMAKLKISFSYKGGLGRPYGEAAMNWQGRDERRCRVRHQYHVHIRCSKSLRTKPNDKIEAEVIHIPENLQQFRLSIPEA